MKDIKSNLYIYPKGKKRSVFFEIQENIENYKKSNDFKLENLMIIDPKGTCNLDTFHSLDKISGTTANKYMDTTMTTINNITDFLMSDMQGLSNLTKIVVIDLTYLQDQKIRYTEELGKELAVLLTACEIKKFIPHVILRSDYNNMDGTILFESNDADLFSKEVMKQFGEINKQLLMFDLISYTIVDRYENTSILVSAPSKIELINEDDEEIKKEEKEEDLIEEVDTDRDIRE